MLTPLKVLSDGIETLKSDRQRRFALEYVALKLQGKANAAQAAIRAGYSKKTAKVAACRLLKKPEIQAYISQVERQDIERLDIDRVELLRQLWFCITRRAGDFVRPTGGIIPIQEMGDRAQSVIDGFEVKERVLRSKDGEEVLERRIKVKLVPKAQAIKIAVDHEGMRGMLTAALQEYGITTGGQDGTPIAKLLEELAKPCKPNPVTERLEKEQKRLEHKGAKR